VVPDGDEGNQRRAAGSRRRWVGIAAPTKKDYRGLVVGAELRSQMCLRGRRRSKRGEVKSEKRGPRAYL